MTDTLLSVFLGIGLSAATGFRVFVPLLILSIAALSGNLTLAPEFAWIGSVPALILFAAATLIEIGGYLIPWLDNLLDAIATPTAIIAGVIVTASVITDMSPVLRWALAIIAGGGAAAIVQSSTVLTRAASTGATGGCANPVVAIIEGAGSALLSILAIVAPIVAGIIALVVVSLLFFVSRKIIDSIRRRLRTRSA
jgi:hypothetical protein